VIHTDDTPVDVLDKNRNQTRTGRFWDYLGDREHPYAVFDYTPSRRRDGPVEFLGAFGRERKVYLQADAFGGYDGIYVAPAQLACVPEHVGASCGSEVIAFESGAGGVSPESHAGETPIASTGLEPARVERASFAINGFLSAVGALTAGIVEVACWAHARRKFYEARNSDPARSAQAMAYVRLLYDVEDQAREKQLDAPARAALRRQLALPRLIQFKAWLEAQQLSEGGGVLPKSPMGQAITYALNQYNALCVYVSDGDLAIDNNAGENALRRIGLGRKNWLFCGSDAGGRTAAILYSLIATCERHKVNPFDYLRDVLARIAGQPISQLAELLPDRWKPPTPMTASTGE